MAVGAGRLRRASEAAGCGAQRLPDSCSGPEMALPGAATRLHLTAGPALSLVSHSRPQLTRPGALWYQRVFVLHEELGFQFLL